MNESYLARLDEYLTDSLVKLLAAHGFEAKPDPDTHADAPPPGPDPTSHSRAMRVFAHRDGDFGAAIGFTGDRLKGALVLSLGRRSLVASMPENLRGRHETDEMLADWAGELANQLLGRVKNGLWSSGVEIAVGTPVTFVSVNLEHFSPDPMVLRRSACLVETGRVVAELEMDCAADIELGEPRAKIGGLDDGEFSLF